jgi:hypothetical protein
MKELINAYCPSLPDASIWIIVVLVSFIITLVGIAGRKYLKASEEFRSFVIEKLEGIYPNTAAYLSLDEKDRITQDSINPINTAGTKFKYYLPFFLLCSFSHALNHYCETAQKTNWEEQIAHQSYPSTKTPESISPKDKFIEAVKGMLKYAK